MLRVLHGHDPDLRIRRVADRELSRLRCIEDVRRSPRAEFPPELAIARETLLLRLGA